jgi:hypothetical protein
MRDDQRQWHLESHLTQSILHAQAKIVEKKVFIISGSASLTNMDCFVIPAKKIWSMTTWLPTIQSDNRQVKNSLIIKNEKGVTRCGDPVTSSVLNAFVCIPKAPERIEGIAQSNQGRLPET